MAKAFRFHYLYRDSGNYKTYGYKNFSNPNNLGLEDLVRELRENLISTEYFYPEQAGIRKFLFHRYPNDDSWYEFDWLEEIESQYQHPPIEVLCWSLKFQNLQ
ncbi:MAG: hypothetical protein ACK5JD_00275 [Mangrovibacterium sp.]